MAEPWDDFEAVAPLALAPPAATADRAQELDRRPLAGRGRRHHDVPRLADDRRRDAGASARRATGNPMSAARSPSRCGRPRGATSKPTCARRPRSRARRRASPTCAPIRKEESARLLEPWLGSGLSLDDLPIPRLIVVKLASGVLPDFAALRQALAAQVAGATLDDHRRWIDRMRTMAETAVAAGIARARPGAGRHRAVGHLRDARRHGDQPPDRRGAAFCRRDRRLHRRPVPAPFPAARPQGRRHRRRRGDLLVRRCWKRRTPGSPGPPAATRPRPCSAASRSASPAIWRSSPQIVLMAMVTALASRRTVNRTLETID